MITVERVSNSMGNMTVDTFDGLDGQIRDGILMITEGSIITMIPLDKVFQITTEMDK